MLSPRDYVRHGETTRNPSLDVTQIIKIRLIKDYETRVEDKRKGLGMNSL
jgi:hypothetical protein